MLYIIALILICLCFYRPSNKKVEIAMLIFMWFLFAFNTYNADYAAYERIYQRIGWGDFWGTTVSEEGYIGLVYVCNRFLHMSYSDFCVLLATIATVLLFLLTKKMAVNRNIVYALFLCFPYWAMVCQNRTYIGFLLGGLGLYCLFAYREKKGTFLFVLLTLAGGVFHRATWFNLCYICIRKFTTRTIVVITTVFSLLMLLFRTQAVVNILSNFVPMQKINNWLLSGSRRSMVGVMLLVLMRIILVFLEWYMCNHKKGKEIGALVYSDEILKVTILSLAILTFEIYIPEYERVFRLPMYLSYCLFADYSFNKRITFRNVPLIYILFIGFYIVFIIYFFTGFSSWFETCFRAMFEYNSFLN